MAVVAFNVNEGARQNAPDAPERLVRAAHEFEGQMMKELLKPMTSSAGSDGEEGDCLNGTGSGVLGEFAAESLGQALSRSGGFGIADRIVAQLAPGGASAIDRWAGRHLRRK